MEDADRLSLVDLLSARPHVRAALLFGSFARGTARQDSDIDLAVLPSAPLSAAQKIDLVEALAGAFGRPADIVDLLVHHGPIAHEAIARGELVYCVDRAAYAERLRQMLYDQEDFVATLRKADKMAIEKWLKTSYAPRSVP